MNTGINHTRGSILDNPGAVRQILEAFKQGRTFLCLHDLAIQSGFKRVSDRNFKDGFNYLVEKGVIKLEQSGWSSEKRGGNSHPKTVILTADLYEVTDSAFQIDDECVNTLMFELDSTTKHHQTQFETKSKGKGHRPRTYCVGCDELVSGDPNGNCKKYPWIISMKLAKCDKVCSYDSFKDKFFDETNLPKHDNLQAWKS